MHTNLNNMNRSDNNIERMRRRFDHEFTALVLKDIPEARTVFAYLKSLTIKFRLDGRGVKEDEILNEIYIRAIKQISEGNFKSVENLIPWVKVAAYNLIREKKREVSKFVDLGKLGDTLSDGSSSMLFQDRDDRVPFLLEAKKKTNPTNQRIIELKYEEDLPWNEVAEILFQEDGVSLSVEALRKRSSRIKSRIREEILALAMTNP